MKDTVFTTKKYNCASKAQSKWNFGVNKIAFIYLLYWWFFQIIRFGQYQIGLINVFIERNGFGEDLFNAIFIIN